ncbi:hypothetical protein JTB14_029569 [Gonioctena quinquepunctata]|nr:hypothetical protein JTB14_029569 [Gonioctena quinquepunctata]
MEQPKSYQDGTNRLCKLLRSLYGLKQTPRCWNRRFTEFLKKCGLQQSSSDACLFIRNHPIELIVMFYVDDGLNEKFLEKLKEEFQITVCSSRRYPGMKIEKTLNGNIFISQEFYTNKMF